MVRQIIDRLYTAYWALPFSQRKKEAGILFVKSIINTMRKLAVREKPQETERIFRDYVSQIMTLPEPSKHYVEIRPTPYKKNVDDPKIIAYYLPQFHPTKENDEWWGLGVTEWNNVCRAVPQFVGHYQPRMPGELGYYDLRIIENMARQVELAKMYGIYGFAFYYYWFDGRRVLDKPLDAFHKNKNIDYPFFLCWANESWTRRFDGTCGEVLLEQNKAADSYRAFIHSVIPYFSDPRYIHVKGRPVLNIYRPADMPDCLETINYWRKCCKEHGVGDPYLIATKAHTFDIDFISVGFDAQSEFQPGTVYSYCSEITDKIKFVRNDFGGYVFDYKDIVLNKKYFQYKYNKTYRAVMPMWDNTPRRNNMGIIFEGATPDLYKTWLKDVLVETKSNSELDETFVFINAWNEWGEGAYLEPDKHYGYAFLNSTREALEETR